MNLSENTESQPETSGLTPRKCALDMLENILDKHQSLDIALDLSKDFTTLEPRDRAFTRMLLTTTLRRLGQIDDLLDFAQERPDTLKSTLIKNILRLGITQMFFMDVPDHASVDTSVRLAESVGMTRQKNFVNAILRSLGRKGLERLNKQDAPRLNTPEWLLKLWIQDYGLNTAGKIAAAHMHEAALDITVKKTNERSDWEKIFQAIQLPTGTLRCLSAGNIRNLEGFEDGKWWIQDAAAALPAQLLGVIKDKTVIDLCAAPGGKTMQLASMGANVIAVDRSAKRMKKVKENLTRTQLMQYVTMEIADASVWTPKNIPNHILLDAPCSATGTIRRHPDTVYLKSPKDITQLCIVQERLLNQAANFLPVDGILIYCTCSLQKDEGERQIERFLARHPRFARIPVKPEEVGGHEELINEHGDIRALPYMLGDLGGLDGFFISRLTLKA